MKVKELKALLELDKETKSNFRNPSFIDMDNEFESNGNQVAVKHKNFTTYKQSTKKDKERFWDKNVIEISVYSPASEGILVLDSVRVVPEGLNTYRCYSAIIRVSNHTKEELDRIAKKKEIEEARKELEKLSGHKVDIGPKLRKKKEKFNYGDYIALPGTPLKVEDKNDYTTPCELKSNKKGKMSWQPLIEKKTIKFEDGEVRLS